MSQQDSTKLNKNQKKQQDKQKQCQDPKIQKQPQKNNKQAQTIKNSSNQFLYYVPHQNKKNNASGGSKSIQRDSNPSKSHSRSRSRDKIKQHKNYDDESSHRYQRQDRRERSRKGTNEVKTSNQSYAKQQAYRKTKFCPQLQRGQCKKGHECNFAHSQSQLRGLPDFKKTKLCIAFKEGKCGKLSSQCKYAHGQAQLRRIPKVSHDRDSKRQRSPIRKDKYASSKQPEHNYTLNQGYMAYQNYMIHQPPAPQYPNSILQYALPPRPLPVYTPPNRVFSDYPLPLNPNPNPNMSMNMNLGNFGPYGAPPPIGGFYPPPPNYDFYGNYPLHPLPPPPPPGYGYSGPKPPM